MKKILLLPIGLMLALGGLAQVPVTGTGSYSQNFDGLISTGTATWTDNSTISNVFSQRTGTGTTYVADAGSSASGTLYSYGAAAATERALGSLGSGNAAAGSFAHGILFQNTSGGNIGNFTVSYSLEQWRAANKTTTDTVAFYYKTSSSTISSLNPNSNSTWTRVSALSGYSVVATGSNTVLDGNTNKMSLTNVVIPGLELANGDYLMIKWDDPDHPSSDHGLAIDDVTVSWAASCSTSSTISPSACGTYTVPSGDETYNTSGTYHDTIPNAAACDSIITINLTINNPTTSTISPVACGTYTVPSGDETYSTAGTYMDTIPNAAGCDSIITINLTFSTSITYYLDSDSDGFGDPNMSTTGCSQPTGYVTNSNDCDDSDPAIGVATVMYYTDADGDGYGDPATGAPACSAGTGMVANGNDCDDNNNTIGLASTWYADTDGDGYGNAGSSVTNCTQPTGYVSDNTDCNDNSNTVYPGATEIPDNGVDEDCSGADLSTSLGTYTFTGTVDCTTQVLTASGVASNLTFSDFSASDSVTCADAANVFNNSGWNTGAAVDLTEYAEFTIYPANCYSIDFTNLSFEHRTSTTGLHPTVHVRSSEDNFTADLFTATIVTPNSYETVSNALSLTGVTDSITFRFYLTDIGSAGATYRLDNVKVNGTVNAITPQTYYADADGDSYGDPAASTSACSQPAGYVSDNTDCNDNSAAEHPGATWYADADGDTFGDAATSQTSCTQPTGYVSNSTDCDDNDNTVFSSIAYYPDTDNDGFGDAFATPTLTCTAPAGFVTDNTDCNDTTAAVHPGATEICDGLDNDCSGTIDEGLATMTYYQDADNDGYGNASVTAVNCAQPAGYTLDHTDCDDTDATIHPGASDTSGNGVDENCDGTDGVLGLNEIAGASLNVFPNPGTENVNIAIEGFEGNVNVMLVSAEGKMVISKTVELTNGSAAIPTSGLTPGVYVIRVSTEAENAVVRWIKK